jgi:hypothetical protein
MLSQSTKTIFAIPIYTMTLGPTMNERHLLLDSRIVENVENTELKLGAVNKHNVNPLFEEDNPWERRFDNLYANIIYDEEEALYKCWYSPFIVSHSTKGMTIQQRKEEPYGKHPQEMGICYATSKDGICWDKPEMGLVDYDGSTANNILWRGGGVHKDWGGPHGTGIFKDLHDPDPARRYKAILKEKILSVAFSADGIHWGPPIACPAANSAGDTHNNAFWAPTLGKYVAITRQWRHTDNEHIRVVARTESDDFINWSETENILEGQDTNQQLYAMPVFFHGGIYLGLVAVHDQKTDRVWTELTWSPDTITWHRVLPGTPLIDNDGEYGDYDWGCVYAAANPVFGDNEIRLYYGGSDGLHTSWRNGFLCMATLRPDGFAGYKAASQSASVTTTPVYNGTASLQVSADIGEGGSLVVRALDDSQRVIAESEAMTSTVSDAEIVWRDASELTKVAANGARLQFLFRNATVYSFTMV